jgi:sugar-specific transcriptional regulator TrmB
MLKKVLSDCGLSSVQIAIFLALIQLDQAVASTLARQVKVPRKTAAFNLDQLVKMGFVHCELKKGAYNYKAANPEKLGFIFEEQIREAQSLKTEFDQIIPDLERLKNPDVVLPKAGFYVGLSGIKKTYEDTLEVNEPIYAFQNVNKMDPSVVDYLAKQYLPARVSQGISAQVITPKNKDHVFKRKQDAVNLRETKFLESSFIDDLEIEINIYGDKTAFMSYNTEELFGVVIESRAIAKSLKALFDYCWDHAS